jgi:hypothetical protein
MIAILLLLMVAGLGAFWFEMQRSVKGYEDEVGFHRGVASPIGFSSNTLPSRAWRENQKVSDVESSTTGQTTLGLS